MTFMRRLASKQARLFLFSFQDGKCALCRNPLEQPFHVDHIQPWSQGGFTQLYNLQAICIECHKIKTKADSRSVRASKP
jgi:5-methylcytosine-specific restriction endonuclease McrA